MTANLKGFNLKKSEREAFMADFGELLARCRQRAGLAPVSITARMKKASPDMLRLRRQGYSPKRIGELLDFDPLEVRMVLRQHDLAD